MNSKLASAIGAALIATIAQTQTPQYNIVSLGSLNGQSEAFAINTNGLAVGWTYTLQGTRQAAIFNGTQVIPLATPAGQNSVALNIDKFSRIVGKVNTQAAQWTSTVSYNTFGTLGGAESTATGINENGLVSIFAQNASARWRPASFLLPNGGLIQLGMLGGLQGGAAGCSNGNIVGWSDLANGQTHATLWANGNTLDFGTLGGPVSQFTDVSEQGAAVGWSYLLDHHVAPSYKGFIRRAVKAGLNHTLVNLGEPYAARPYPTTFATGIKGFVWKYYDHNVLKQANVIGVDVEATGWNKDTITGNATLYLYPTGLVRRAVAWVNGQFYDLTNLVPWSKWTLQLAWGVNNKGQIVGQGQDPNGKLIAYRLDPTVGSGSGLSYVKFLGYSNGTATPVYANAVTANVIPTVTLYVRKSDGMLSTALAGPYTSTGLYTWIQTSPVKVGVNSQMVIDERSTPVSPNGVNNWNSVCNGLQSSYSSFKTSPDGSIRAIWNGSQIASVLSFFPNDTELSSRWKYSMNGTNWLYVRLKIRKGAGY